MSARNLNPKQIALEGVNWNAYKDPVVGGRHPLGFPRGEQYAPSAVNELATPETPGQSTGYHVTTSARKHESIMREGLYPTRDVAYIGNGQDADRSGVYVVPQGRMVASSYSGRDDRGGVYQVTGPSSTFLVDPAHMHPGAKRVLIGAPEDPKPVEAKLVGHVANRENSGAWVSPLAIHWGTMHPNQCESCNLADLHEKSVQYTRTYRGFKERNPKLNRANREGRPYTPEPTTEQPRLAGWDKLTGKL